MISTNVSVGKDLKKNLSNNDLNIGSSATVFSKFEKHDPLVWFLYEDLDLSARSLSNQYLNKSICATIQLMFCTHYYFAGIHTPRMFKILFNSEHLDETVDRVFPGFDFTYKFKFSFYKNKAAKWARKCYEHYDMMERYLLAMLAEWNYRFPKNPHKMTEIAFYLIDQNNIKSKLPKANLKKIDLDWKSIGKKYRNKDTFLAFRNYYCSKISDPFDEYKFSNRDIPQFVLEKTISIV